MDGELVKELGQAMFASTDEQMRKALMVLRGECESVVKSPPPEPFVTLKECAKAVGISSTSLWRFRIPKRPMAGRPKFLVSEVLQYLNSNEFRAHAKRLRKDRALKNLEAK